MENRLSGGMRMTYYLIHGDAQMTFFIYALSVFNDQNLWRFMIYFKEIDYFIRHAPMS